MNKPVDVDSHGNAVKKKKNNNYSFKKKPVKDLKKIVEKKPVRKIKEYYYFINQTVDARKLQEAVGEKWFEQADIWPELNLMEVTLDTDSLIFQDATECFVDPLDQAWLQEQNIAAKYQISFDTADITNVRAVMKQIMSVLGGRVCSDTDDFEPSYTAEDIFKIK